MKRLKRYFKKKRQQLNTGKTKIMVFWKSSRGRRRELKVKWENSKIEVVKEFSYLGYFMTEDISNK